MARPSCLIEQRANTAARSASFVTNAWSKAAARSSCSTAGRATGPRKKPRKARREAAPIDREIANRSDRNYVALLAFTGQRW